MQRPLLPRSVLVALVSLVFFVGSALPDAQGRPGGQGQPPRAGRGAVPPRDSGADSADAAAGTGVITGTLVVSGSGAPARHARMSLSGADLRGARQTTTDDQGRFVFVGLPAGRFTLSASKPGHVPVTYGQRQMGPGRPGTPIQLSDGQKLSVQMQIPRGSVISGTVLDENGEAVPGTQVRVFRWTMQSGVKTLAQAGNDATDDRGIYRIYGLQPGDYLVCATPRQSLPPGAPPALDRLQEAMAAIGPRGAVAASAMADRLAAPAGQEDQTAGYAPVYFPGTTIAGNATSLPIAAGEERLGVDFQLQLAPLARIDGMVVSPAAQEQPGVQVLLVNTGDEVSGIGGSAARVDGQGRFSFSNVAPGQYTLIARTSQGRPLQALVAGIGARGDGPGAPQGPGVGRGGGRGGDGPRLWAAADVSVDGRNIANVVLTLQPGFAVTGRVEFRGTAAQAPADLTRVRVSLTPADVTPGGRELATPANGRVDENGRFTIDGVVPGRYRLSAGAGASGWTLDSGILAGQETLDFPVEIRSSQNLSGAVIVFSDQQTTLSGGITDGRSQPVSDYTLVLYPSDERYWSPQSRRIRSVRPATDGTFNITGIPPGDYRLAPVLDPEPGSWFDPSFLQQLDASALRLTMTEGEKKVQNLRIGGWYRLRPTCANRSRPRWRGDWIIESPKCFAPWASSSPSPTVR